MDRRRLLSFYLWYLLPIAVAALVVWLLPSENAGPLSAAPHKISSRPHPLDPDWPAVHLLIAEKCAGCHAPNTDNIDLSSYQALLSAKNEEGHRIFVPGRPEESPLWTQVVWNVDAARDSQLPDEPMMPDEQAHWLTRGQLETLRRWIENGGFEYALPDGCSAAPLTEMPLTEMPLTEMPLTEMDFPSAKQCKTCHPGQYDEWSGSMHHYAQHSPVFEAFNLTLIERTSGTIGTFCSRCHTPIGTALGENGSRRNVNRSQISMEGVTCIVCHRIKGPVYKNNGRLAITPGKLLEECIYGPFDDPATVQRKTHSSAGSSYLKSAAFCGTCHDVTSPDGTRLEEAFSEWQNSPAAKQGTTCQHCHMGPTPGVATADSERPLGRAAVVPGVDPKQLPLRRLSNHSFVGPDYSMLPDAEFPEKLDWMYEVDYRDTKRLTPHQQRTLIELRQHNRKRLRKANDLRYQLLHKAATIKVNHPRTASACEKIDIRVDVTNHVSGHSFPTGFTAERQLWVDITVQDPLGRIVFRSGDLDRNGDLRDEHSRAVLQGKLSPDRYLLNFQNKFTALNIKGTERTVPLPVNRNLAPLSIVRPSTSLFSSHGRGPSFRIAKGSLPPLKTIGRNYPVKLLDTPGETTVTVRLSFRHLPPILLDHIGVPYLKRQLEIVVIDRYTSTIDVRRVGHRELSEKNKTTEARRTRR